MLKYLVTALVLYAAPCLADVRLPKIIGSNMVLQRESEVKIWGWADADEEICVSCDWMDKQATVNADGDGNWQVRISTAKAGEPHTMTIAGKNSITLENILFGEVWIGSGQSNMEMPLLKVSAAYTGISMYGVPRASCKWQTCTPETIPTFASAAYFFARELQAKLKVPVGVIDASWGGTSAEAWISPFNYRNLNANYLREAQLQTMSLPKTGMVVTMDIGNLTDIHPKNKQEVGRRLALWALANDYGRDVVYSGPIYKQSVFRDGKARLKFHYIGSGLATRDDVVCPNCSKSYRVNEADIAKKGRCKKCDTTFFVKSGETLDPPQMVSGHRRHDPTTTSVEDDVPEIWQPGDVILDTYGPSHKKCPLGIDAKHD